MEVKELRIGNAFLQDGSNFIEYVTIETLELLRRGHIIICPVLITDEKLLSYGFIRHKSNRRIFWSLDMVSFEAVFSDNSKAFDFCQFAYHSSNSEIRCFGFLNFKYIHELQNLFFTLKNKELIKIKKL